MADLKPAARKFCLKNYGDIMKHFFCSNKAFMNGSGQCLVHGGLIRNKVQCAADLRVPDVLVAGLPCQPVTQQRFKGGGTEKTGSAHAHPLMRVIEEPPHPSICWLWDGITDWL